MKIYFQSILNIERKRLWDNIHTFERVNFELFPMMKMTTPSAYKIMPLENFPVNVFVFKSIVLLFGLIPIEVSSIRLKFVKKNEGFIEESKMLLSRDWKHTRNLSNVDGKCKLEDIIEVRPRWFLLKPVLWVFIKLLFANRHRRVKKFSDTDDEIYT